VRWAASVAPSSRGLGERTRKGGLACPRQACPHEDPRLRTLTARDRLVLQAVRRTPGIRQLLAATVAQAQAYARGPGAGEHPLDIAVGCAGGRHRGVDRTTARHAGRERIPRVA
jgi:hypothetical protein